MLSSPTSPGYFYLNSQVASRDQGSSHPDFPFSPYPDNPDTRASYYLSLYIYQAQLLDRDIEELSKDRIKRKDTAYNPCCIFFLVSNLYLDKGFTNFLILRGSNFFILSTSLSCTNMEDTLHDHLRVSDMHSLRLE